MALNEAIRNTSATVGTSVVEVSPQINEGQVVVRCYTNVSTGGQVISLAWNAEAVSGSGDVLYPAGTHSESIDSAFIPSNARVTAVASAAGGSLAIHERVRMGR